MSGALEKLLWHYQHRSAEAREQHKAGVPVVGFTSNTVPWELIRAAGCFPVLIGPDLDVFEKPAPFADSLMEPVFDSRIRAIFHDILSGAWSFLRLLIIPRTSEPEYKLYLYLREVGRQNPELPIPPVYLYDLLHARSSETYSYGLERTLCLKRQLEELTGKPIDNAAILQAIKESNAARRVVRKLLCLRQLEPRVSGAEALALIGSFFCMSRDEYAFLVEKAVKLIEQRNPLSGIRILITGASLNHRGLHQALERHGAVVVAEDNWWGSRSAGKDIDEGSDDLIMAIFEKHYLDTPSPRLFPFEIADAWFHQASNDGIDAVVFYLPPEDCVAGWDYPRRRRYLDEKRIPHFLLREDASSISAECHERIGKFVRSIRVGR